MKIRHFIPLVIAVPVLGACHWPPLPGGDDDTPPPTTVVETTVPGDICLDPADMILSNDHDGTTVWYADGEYGPYPAGFSTPDKECIHPY